jgi:hypothetical protein
MRLVPRSAAEEEHMLAHSLLELSRGRGSRQVSDLNVPMC